MATKDVRVNLLFQADTSAALNNMQQLSQHLHQISNETKISIDGGAMNKAIEAAQSLQVHLQNAVNVDTGKLDLAKFNSSLKTSGQSLSTLVTDLQNVGTVGQQAFIKLANSIANAQTPAMNFGAKIKDFTVTLANTAKWQVASKAIHGIEGMMSSAMHHAEDLNRALNDIRIVTGYSKDTMADFAVEASSAAKELSTTTTEYSKAALIFYQQGLSGEAVTERADVVVKLAQVTGQSAQIVSDQMTAIWNNFDDGSHSLEYYADVLAKLGAATAADTQEITDGLSKFAAVADTVGLSYETAAAAVATVVDKTKQSAEVVGTSFKTIFARMQGLSLGETLEDGVDLNKYSEALKKVGINVLDAKGEMRDMDDILNELGEKWEGFGETTQIAIAQTVGGIRQYNQMISLMDNWDSVKANIETATDATGELTKQQAIWSQSYEAAANRVKQAQNEIYESFINSEDVVKLQDIFASFLGTIAKVIDKFGGIGPVVLTLAGVFSKVLFPLVQQGMKTLINNLNVLTGKAAKDVAQMQNLMKAEMTDMMNKSQMSQPMQQQLILSKDLITQKQKLAEATKNMSAAEAQEAQQRMQVYEAMVLQAQESLERQEQLRKEIELSEKLLTTGVNRKALATGAAKESFAASHSDMDRDEIDSLAEDATSMTTRQVKMKQAALPGEFAQRRADLEFQIQDVETAPGLAEEERTKQVQELTDALNQLEQEEKDQIARYERILELQGEMRKQEKKSDVKTMSVGKAEGFFTDTEEDNDPTTRGMTGKVASELAGAQETEVGSIEVDASLGNLETLITKMSEYQTQATDLDALQRDLNQTFFDSAVPISSLADPITQAANSMDAYEQSLTELDAAEAAYSAAVEKVAKAQDTRSKNGKKDKAATDALKKAKKELAAAEQNLIKAQSKVSAILQDSSKSSQNYTKQLVSLEKALKKAAASSANVDDELLAIDNAFDKLKGGDLGGLDDLSGIMERLKVSSLDTVGGIDVLASSIQEQLLASGMNASQLDAFINQLVEMGAITPEVANKLKLVGDAGDNLNKIPTNADLAISALQGVATAAGSISSAVSGIKMFVSAFEEGVSPLDATMSILSGITMIMPALIGAYKGIVAIKKAKTILDAAENAAEATGQALSLKTIAANAGETTSYWALVAAKLASLAASNPALAIAALAVIGATTAAVIGYTIATNKQTESQKKLNEETIETTEKANEASTAWQDQSSQVDTLIAQYKDLAAAGADVKAIQEDLKNSAEDLTAAYTEMGNVFKAITSKDYKDMSGNTIDYATAIQYLNDAMVAGNVEQVEYYKNQLDSAITPEAADAAKEGAKAAANTLATTLDEDGGASIDGTKVTRSVGGLNHVGGNEENKSVDILERYDLGTATGTGNGFDITMDTADTGKFLQQYEDLLAAKKDMEAELSATELSRSDTYREISEMIDATETEYEKLKEMQAEADKYGVVDVTEGFQEDGKTFDSGEAMDVTNINSLEEYVEYRDAILNDPSIKGDAAAEQAALDWLAAQGHLTEYEEARAKMASAADIVGKAISESGTTSDLGADKAAIEASLQSFYNDLSAEDQALFMEIDFNEVESKADLYEQIDMLREEADKAEQIEIATTADIDEDELESYIDLLKQTEEGAKLSESALTMIAVANKRLEKGTGTLAKDWADLNDVMTDSESSMTDLSKVMPTINDGLQDILNLSDEQFELLPPDFAQKNWSLIQDVMNGVDGAVEKLRSKAGEEILLTVDGVVDPNGNINQGIMDVHNAINSFDASSFEIGVAIDPTAEAAFYESCQSMINAAGMTADQASAYFGSMGYDVTFSDNPQTVQEQVTEYEYSYDYDDDGNPTYRHVTPVIKTVETTIDAPTIETITPNGSYGGSTLVEDSAPQSSVKEAKESGGSGGSGGSEKKEEEFEPAEKLKKEDVVERYKETEDAIDDVADAYDDASKAADRLYGAGRIAMMAKANGQLLKEIGLLKQKKKQAQEYLKLDKIALDEAATSAGIQLQYDANGNIVNYTQELGRLVDEYNELVDAVNEDGQKTEEEVDQLEAKKKAIDDVTEALENYEGTREEIEDIENEMRDKFYEWQDNNFEMWSHSLEVSLDITDDAKQLLDALLSRTEGNFYMQAEGLALMGAQFALTNAEMGTYIGHLGMLGGLMATGSISPADFVEGLDQVQQGAMNAAQALMELHDKMVHYYGNALQMGLEEIDVYTDQLEHCTSVLEHYLTLLELTGQQTNYDAIGTVIEGQIQTSWNEMDAAHQQYLWLQEEANDKYLKKERALFSSQAEVFEQQYKDAIAAATEAEEEFLSKAEAYAGYLNAKLENDLAKFNQELEDALTGGTSFDQMTTKMEHMVSIQEEYLTTTNKIYETEKLMNQAQQEIDKSSNAVAKQRLKQFITETNQLKEKNQLSKFELDVQKAKYEILLAEIALEEAQNAKSQVRLQRDNAGNFGYVYTADSSAIADAQQELADKQNAFYNMALEGVNTYAEKYYQTLEEMYTTLTEIDQQYRDGAFASFTEYEEYRAEVQKHYYDKLKQYSEIYNIAIQLDSDATAESWGQDYYDMVNSTDVWATAVATHTDNVKVAFQNWTDEITRLADLTGTSMTKLANSVAVVTKKSDDLKNKTDEVIDKVKEEMAAVSMLTAIYAALSGVVMALAAAYMALAMAIMVAKMAASMGGMLGAIDLSGASDVISQAGDALTDSAESSGGGTGGTSATSSGGDYKVGDTVKYTGGDYYHDSYGSSPSGHRGAGKEVTITHIVPGAEKPIHVKSNDSAYGWLTEDEIARLDSGGYTGAWGSYGKLAVLDEKELVLNADDTKNFLASMSLLDSIVSTIDLHAANHSIGGLLNSPRMGDLENNTLEQTVTIEANFPSVSSRTEIEEAFSTIVNRASQYANRK